MLVPLDPSKQRGAAVMAWNPSYVFFREIHGFATNDGPIGSLGWALAAGRNPAVDPEWHAPGSTIRIGTRARDAKLVVAKDTGMAIRHALGADLTSGTDDDAREAADALAALVRLVRVNRRGGGRT